MKQIYCVLIVFMAAVVVGALFVFNQKHSQGINGGKQPPGNAKIKAGN